jgi:hypothetical protein
MLASRLAGVLREVADVVEEADGALTVTHGGAVASLRVVPIDDELELISLTQLLAWDLLVTNRIRGRVAEQTVKTLLGTVALVEKSGSTKADVLLRYNFPAAGLSDDALRTLILMVLAGGEDVRDARGPDLAAGRAGPEDLDGVTDVGKAMCGSHFGGPGLDLAAGHLHRRAAGAAHQMVVVMRPRAAPVDRFAGVGAQGVHDIGRRHRLQGAVDGGQPDVLAGGAARRAPGPSGIRRGCPAAG